MKEHDKYDHNKFIEVHDAHIRAHGGDGTLLRAIAKHRDKGLPFFGTAAGTVNFLMNKDTYIKPDSTTKQLTLIAVKVVHTTPMDGLSIDTEITETFYAFNDVVLGNFNAWINFDCRHHDDILGAFNGSGLIISTAQGSTGSSKNNGGVVLPLAANEWVVTGIMCNRKINFVLDPEPIKISTKSRGTTTLAVDGTTHVINNVKEITVSRGASVDVIFNDYHEFKKKRQR